jgi:aminopeptidase N
MKTIKLTLLFIAIGVFFTFAQENNNNYQPEKEKINDLIHTKLKVSFDFAKRQMPAEAWITLKPHFYSVQKVTLDAKGMLIEKVSRDGKNLMYDYDDKKLVIQLGNTYTSNEQYTIYIKYTAKPEDLKPSGSAAITSEKGLYFIDPDGTNPDRPTEIWTQGATESSSVWFPTIDSPNQKTTQEIYMTVPSKFVTLSNGLLESQIENGDGTRTDYWKMDLKHAPYLFFMGVGDFSIVKDTYKNIAVDYYVDRDYEPYAREIFGNTPEMMAFFSKITGVDYVWPKYAQMVAYDYVSGAMENTTATLHGSMAYQTSGQLIDFNAWEDVIAHELFHQWFGDLVTTESWSNITVNESFANYSEYLWREYKYGKDHADAHMNTDLQGYFFGKNDSKNLVRFNYTTHMDVFDAVSYNKGGGILHMLRNYLGDKAFFAGLKEFLTANKFGTAEAHQLRLAFEKVSGKDLNWFFNQWYFGSGHPVLDLRYSYDENNKQAVIKIKQKGDKLFNFPIKIDVYENGAPKTYHIWVNKKEDLLAFKVKSAPKLIDFDVDKTLLAKITDNKTTENYIFQYEHAPSYANRLEAIQKLAELENNTAAKATIIKALKDPYYGIRILALKSLDLKSDSNKKTIAMVKDMISKDLKTLVQGAAIKAFSSIASKSDITIFETGLQSKSFSVMENSLTSIYKLDKTKAISFANSITDEKAKESMKDVLIEIYVDEADTSQLPFIGKNLISGLFFSQSPEKQKMYGKAFQMLAKSDNEEATKYFVNDAVSKGLQFKQYGADKMLLQMLQQMLMQKGDNSNLKAIINMGIEKLK